LDHPFVTLQPEYDRLLSSVRVTRPQVVSRGVDEIERVLASYEQTAADNGVPAGWIGPTDCRESDCNPRCGIGQGDPWNEKSVHVPRGEGPFASKAEADKFYLHYDHVDVLPTGVTVWSLALGCWKWEGWNGWGPRNHGRLSGYLWACTDAYDTPAYGGHGVAGKYVADGVWDPNKLDPQPGAVALYFEFVRRHPSLAIGSPILHVPFAPSIVPAQTPVGVHDGAALQKALNSLGADPMLQVDGNPGRMTRRAVFAFQQKNGLQADGLAGPATWAKIGELLKLP
jgi:lysozyme family protein